MCFARTEWGGCQVEEGEGTHWATASGRTSEAATQPEGNAASTAKCTETNRWERGVCQTDGCCVVPTLSATFDLRLLHLSLHHVVYDFQRVVFILQIERSFMSVSFLSIWFCWAKWTVVSVDCNFHGLVSTWCSSTVLDNLMHDILFGFLCQEIDALLCPGLDVVAGFGTLQWRRNTHSVFSSQLDSVGIVMSVYCAFRLQLVRIVLNYWYVCYHLPFLAVLLELWDYCNHKCWRLLHVSFSVPVSLSTVH